MSLNPALQVLQDRGFIKQCTDLEGLNRQMEEAPIAFYLGIDPTGPSLHVGHMVPVFALSHLQKAGHKPVLLSGGGTARIGDPSGKTEMRKLITYEEIAANSKSQMDQLKNFVHLDGENGWMMNNADWLAQLNYIDFLREIGSQFSVNRMLSFEAYKMRMETGLSFIEFNYQLLQSYDYLELYRRKGCRLQIGGDDQWGNIVAGIDLIRRLESAEVYGLTFPLVTRSDGKKMGKTEKGAVFLDPSLTSPYDMFQYWRNVPDADVEKFMLLFTFLEVAEIKELCKGEGVALNAAKERLAYEYTKLVHGEAEAENSLAAAKAAFGGGGDTSNIPSLEIPAAELNAGIGVLDLFARSGLCSSNGEARRLVQQGGARINDVKVESIDEVIDSSRLEEGGLMLKAGKKRYFRVAVK